MQIAIHKHYAMQSTSNAPVSAFINTVLYQVQFVLYLWVRFFL